MSNINKIIMCVATSKGSTVISYIRGFSAKTNGEIVPEFTGKKQQALKFGPEAVLHLNWLMEHRPYNVEGNLDRAYTLMEATREPDLSFDDGKDYSTVDIAVEISGTAVTSWLYNEFKELGYSYKQDMGGNLINIGNVGGNSVYVGPMIHVIEGVRVLYVEPTSGIVDHGMVCDWVAGKVGKDVEYITDPGRLKYAVRDIVNARKEEVPSE